MCLNTLHSFSSNSHSLLSVIEGKRVWVLSYTCKVFLLGSRGVHTKTFTLKLPTFESENILHRLPRCATKLQRDFPEIQGDKWEGTRERGSLGLEDRPRVSTVGDRVSLGRGVHVFAPPVVGLSILQDTVDSERVERPCDWTVVNNPLPHPPNECR